MPRGDGTGPAGMGPMTGRAAGYCAGFNVPGFMNPYGGAGRGRGFGMGYGRGRGRGFGRGLGRGLGFGYAANPYYAGPAYYPQPNAEDELAVLRDQSEQLSRNLEDINTRISELENKEQ